MTEVGTCFRTLSLHLGDWRCLGLHAAASELTKHSRRGGHFGGCRLPGAGFCLGQPMGLPSELKVPLGKMGGRTEHSIPCTFERSTRPPLADGSDGTFHTHWDRCGRDGVYKYQDNPCERLVLRRVVWRRVVRRRVVRNDVNTFLKVFWREGAAWRVGP